jgi:cytochrome P450
MLANSVPEHVPPGLIREFNFFDMAGETDVYRHFGQLHQGPDIFYSTALGGHWVLTRHADMEAVMNNPEIFSNRHQTIPPNPITLTLLEFDGELHKDFRKLLAPYFMPKKIEQLESMATRLTIELIDDFYHRGECDFVAEFTLKMPIIILMNLMGLPEEDTPHLIQISEDIVRSGQPEVQQAAFGRVFDYMANVILPARKARPGDDIFSTVMAGTVDGGRKVTDQEIINLGALLIAAGLDTVAGTLGFIGMFLAQSPGHRKQLVDNPDLTKNAVEEFLRRFSIPNVARVVTADTEVNGVQMKAGELVLIPLSCAGIDERRYEDPYTVDFNRPDKKAITFGRGPHQCIGALLARTELRVFLREWMKRIPDFSIKEGVQPIVVPGKANSVRYLPLVWHVEN